MMGALNSILDSSLNNDSSESDASPKTPKQGYQDNAPKLVCHKRILDLDPRSPSEGIFRTPIVVSKTPSTPLVGPASASGYSMNDPRSPTNEFSRTPILPAVSTSVTNRSPARSSIFLDAPNSGCTQYASSESGIDSRDVSPDIGNDAYAGLISIESPDSVLGQEDCLSESSEYSPLSAVETTPRLFCPGDGQYSSQLTSNMGKYDSTPEPTVVKEIVRKNIEIEETPKSQCVLKSRGKGLVDKRLGVLSMKSMPPRSPLALVENSPRTALTKLNTNRPAYDLSVDKENRV